MKRGALIRHLSKHGCELAREGSRHSIWKNKHTGEMTTVPRHNEIKEFMAHKFAETLVLSSHSCLEADKLGIDHCEKPVISRSDKGEKP